MSAEGIFLDELLGDWVRGYLSRCSVLHQGIMRRLGLVPAEIAVEIIHNTKSGGINGSVH